MSENLVHINHVPVADDRASRHVVIGIKEILAVVQRIHEADKRSTKQKEIDAYLRTLLERNPKPLTLL